MFRRKAVRNTNEDYCPVLRVEHHVNETNGGGGETRNDRIETPRAELFVLAANIYFRARRNTRARAAGII